MNVKYLMWGSIVDWPPMVRVVPTSLIVRMKRLQSYDRRLLGKIKYVLSMVHVHHMIKMGLIQLVYSNLFIMFHVAMYFFTN